MDRTFVPSRQRGMGIVETMVGILIGMIVVVAIYNVFAVAEGYKRTAVGAADAQTTGLYAQFVLAREIANAGNGVSADGADLATCTIPDVNWVTPGGFFTVPNPRPIRPIPVLIRDGGGPNQSDSLIVTYSASPRVVSPVLVQVPIMAAANAALYVQSPNGFRANDLVIAMGRDGTGYCELITVTAVSAADPFGIVALSHPAVNKPAPYYGQGSQNSGGTVLNLGPGPGIAGQESRATRTLFDVFNAQLRTTDLFVAGATANPIAQNIVLMKAQYGVDCLSNGVILWTSATASNICGDARDYRPDDFVPNPPTVSTWDAPNLSRIRAIRIGVVVRSDEPDLKLPLDPSVASGTRPQVVLFNCSTNNPACQGRIVLPAGPVVALGSDVCAPAIICDTWRYRTYETIVPMRNAIYNNGT